MSDFDALLSLYHRAFPLSERRADDAFVRSIESPDYRLHIHREADRIIGFALCFTPRSDSFSLLEYLAVDSAHQGKGVGSQLLGACLSGRPLLIEVESPTVSPAAARRIEFYRRHGCHLIDGLDYLLPLPNNPPPMKLMIHALANRVLDGETLKHWLSRIYVDVYGCERADPRLIAMNAQFNQILPI
ncbi:MAG: GNAT family N-acetyltransferase [Phycisphaerae bacterium]|nr:GNAT family N-acetyltransferase [Phycisphaerae bacterium]